jgi:uncharacterized protein YjbJ (UPF0337 family)
MKSIYVIIAGVSVGAAVMYFLFIKSSFKHDTSHDSIEDAARDAVGWGTRQRVKGKGRSFAGAVKEGIGRVMGKEDLAEEGIIDQAVGATADAAGKFGHAVGQTIHDLNR